MNRVKILALLATVALLALVPIGLYAQAPVAPHRFFGTVTMIDGSVAPDGTVVAAWMGGEEVATAEVESSYQAGFYLLDVPAPTGTDATVTFTVDGLATEDSVTWAERASEERNLTAIAAMMEEVVVGASLTMGLFELNSSGQNGSATLTEMGDDLQVDLSLNPGALNTKLAHIHSGQCGATLGGVDYGLTSFVGGSGESTKLVEGVTLAMVQDGNHAINLHWAESGGTYTACGNIPAEGEPQPLPVTGVGKNLIALELPPVVDTDALTLDVKNALVGDRLFNALIGGKDGEDGTDGVNGVNGARGRDGSAGGRGGKGDPGPQGVAGSQGNRGGAGANGTNGSDGRQGPQGLPGVTGDDGGGGALGVVALILAIVALVGVGGAFAMSRRS